MEREDVAGSLFVITVTGLLANEAFKAMMRSENEGGKLSPKANSAGIWRSVLGAAVEGRTSGTGSIDIKSKFCELHMEYTWGTATSPK
jgi:hypothetical protein